MKEETRKHCLALLFFLSLIMAAGIFFYSRGAFRTDSIKISGERKIKSLSEGWYYVKDGKKTKIKRIPQKIKDNSRQSLTIYLDLSKQAPEDPVLCMENFHQMVEVYVEGQKVYSYGSRNKGPAGWILGNIWNVADLPENVQGKTIAVRITAPNTPGTWKIPEIQYGNRSQVTQMIRDDCFEIGVFAVLSGVLGLCFLLVYCLLRYKRLDFNRKDFMYFGIFILISTLWIITDSKIPQFITTQLAPVYILSFLLFTLLPVPYLFFLRQICRHGKTALDCLSLLFILQVILSAVLYLAGLADLIKTLPVTHVLIACTAVISVFLCLREQFHYHNNDTFFVLIGICVLAVGAILSLVTFHPQGSGDNSLFFRCGLIGFYVFLCYGSLKRGVGLLRTSMETETFRTMAYKDTMTGIGNRAAFDRDAKHLQEQGNAGPYAVAVFDINNLKYVNDTYGHTAGDELIRNTAKAIKKAFSAIGECYRIGGDEFVVVMENVSEEMIRTAFQEFEQDTQKYSEWNPGGLNVAGGYAQGENSGPDFVYHLFRKADAEMYGSKEKTKKEMPND